MFRYQMDTSIHFGVGEANAIGQRVGELQTAARVLVVTDPGVERAGLVEPLVDALQAAGHTVTRFNQVAPNPRDTDCLVGAEQFRAEGIEVVVGVGGGSAMDTAKAIALIGAHGGKPVEYADGLRRYATPAPVVCVPTTAGTGSEVTRSAVITEAATHRKLTLKAAALRPKLAILDPLLTLTVPPSVTAATGVDALVHAIEGSTCTLASPITRAFGLEAMRRIVPALPRAYADGQDVEARTEMLVGSLLAGLCFGASDVAAVHCLAEALGGLYDTPHGVANAVFLPEVLRFNAPVNPAMHAELARTMGFADATDGDGVAVEQLLNGIRRFTAHLGIPRLCDLPGVRREDFDQLAELAFANNSTPSNVRPVSLADYRRILDAVYDAGGADERGLSQR
ncbi:MAG: iron-containing alcohol dehydrogenase [Alicyclobacillus sp.]|nr:iron-containing alcohol dehydrogenase [Alicyclobacillus sp.]